MVEGYAMIIYDHSRALSSVVEIPDKLELGMLQEKYQHGHDATIHFYFDGNPRGLGVSCHINGGFFAYDNGWSGGVDIGYKAASVRDPDNAESVARIQCGNSAPIERIVRTTDLPGIKLFGGRVVATEENIGLILANTVESIGVSSKVWEGPVQETATYTLGFHFFNGQIGLVGSRLSLGGTSHPQEMRAYGLREDGKDRSYLDVLKWVAPGYDGPLAASAEDIRSSGMSKREAVDEIVERLVPEIVAWVKEEESKSNAA